MVASYMLLMIWLLGYAMQVELKKEKMGVILMAIVFRLLFGM